MSQLNFRVTSRLYCFGTYAEVLVNLVENLQYQPFEYDKDEKR